MRFFFKGLKHNVSLVDWKNHTKGGRRINDDHQKNVEVEISRQALDTKLQDVVRIADRKPR